MDLSQLTMSSVASHLIAVLIGVATGSAGTYFANKYTDKRREGEVQKAAGKKFEKLQEQMPTLFQEMIDDVTKPEFVSVREFFVLQNRQITLGGSSKVRFQYFQSEHTFLRENIDLLIQAGFLTDATVHSAPIFRMSEAFVELLRR